MVNAVSIPGEEHCLPPLERSQMARRAVHADLSRRWRWNWESRRSVSFNWMESTQLSFHIIPYQHPLKYHWTNYLHTCGINWSVTDPTFKQIAWTLERPRNRASLGCHWPSFAYLLTRMRVALYSSTNQWAVGGKNIFGILWLSKLHIKRLPIRGKEHLCNSQPALMGFPPCGRTARHTSCC